MKTLKNNMLIASDKPKLCKIHNGKKGKLSKAKLYMYKSHSRVKTYYPLKRKKIKINRLKLIQNIITDDIRKAITFLEELGNPILSKKYVVDKEAAPLKNNGRNENEIIDWLRSENIEIKRIAKSRFILKNKICSFNNILVFANRKRVELGLKPFYWDGIDEY
ncbi:MAG: hypothetical protein LBO02_02295 [Holosporaceae bacterium]|jgi:hypothetical protein|nr:hypothetical protein [Holosporaceae bacterium]